MFIYKLPTKYIYPSILIPVITALIICITFIFVHPVMAEIVPGPTQWPGGRWVPDEPKYGMKIKRNVPITMDDGAVIYANIGYPTDLRTGFKARGKFPVLLTQNPYNIPFTNISAFQPPEFFVSRGYIYVVAQVRGTGFTEGPMKSTLAQELFSDRQAEDGAQLVDWAAYELDKSNGVIGLDGCSFLGISQIFTVSKLNPGSPVKAMIPSCAGNGYEIYFPGGMLSGTYALQKMSGSTLLSGQRNANANTAHLEQISSQYYNSGPEAYNGNYWQSRTTANAAAKIVENGIPALLWSGWNAAEITETMLMYSSLQNEATQRDPFAPMMIDQPLSGRYQMVIGPGGHGAGLDRTIMLAWFDHWLKGQNTGIDETDTPMHLHEQKADRWINASTIPFVETYTSFYAGDAGKLTPISDNPGQDLIHWASPEKQGSSVTYTSAPMAEAKTIAGPSSVSVWASSSNTNMQLVADLHNIAPDGTATPITHGALIGSMRTIDTTRSWYDSEGKMIQPYHPFLNDEYLIPGTPQLFAINLFPTLWRLKAGHSLSLTITTQVSESACGIISALSLPRPCFLTLPQENTLPGGEYTIYRGGSQATVINLPLLDPKNLSTAKSSTTATSTKQTQPLEWRVN